MKTELAVALIAGVVALISGAATILSSSKNSERAGVNARAIEQLKIDSERLKADAQRRKEVANFSEPLARSAYDLQSRFYNILRQNFIEVYLTDGRERERSYVINNTAYLVAQYFCWVEQVRREIQFIDLGEDTRTRHLLHLQDTIHSHWSTDAHSAAFRIFSGEQRAIGEALIQTSDRGSECVGYGAFLKNFGPGANPLIDALRADIQSLETGLGQATDRLKSVQNALIDLLKMLDPDYLRFPEDRRSKV